MPPEATTAEPTKDTVATADQAATQQVAEAVDPNALTVNSLEKFHFKKNKELGTKRPTLDLMIPKVTMNGLLTALTDEKQQAYILSLVNDAVFVAVREQLNSEEKIVEKQDDLDISKLSLEYLANQPANERRGGGISKEVWEDWGKDYLEVMPAATGKTLEQTSNAIKLFIAKFQPVKTQKQVIKALRELLAIWLQKSQNAEDFMECYEFLDKKAETLLAADEAALLANL